MAKKGIFVRLPIALIERLDQEKEKREKSFQETVRDLLEERLKVVEAKSSIKTPNYDLERVA